MRLGCTRWRLRGLGLGDEILDVGTVSPASSIGSSLGELLLVVLALLFAFFFSSVASSPSFREPSKSTTSAFGLEYAHRATVVRPRSAGDVDGGELVADLLAHLRGDEVVPDQRRDRLPDAGRHAGAGLRVGGADRFVGFWGIGGLGGVDDRLGRQVAFAKLLGDQPPASADGLRRA